MIDGPHPIRVQHASRSDLPLASRGVTTRVALVVLLSGYSLGCQNQVVVAVSNTAEGEAILTALKQVAAIKKGAARENVAVKHGDATPLSESTRGFLNEAFATHGWRWSVENPLVTPEECAFPIGNCSLKDPKELHLTFYVKPLTEDKAYNVHVVWLSSYGPDGNAGLGAHGVSVTRDPKGWRAKAHLAWIS